MIKKKLLTISMLIGSIILMSFLVVKTTYSLITNVSDDAEVTKIITIRELFTDSNGIYNAEYYKVMEELNVSNSDMGLLIDSVELNKALMNVVNSEKYSNSEIYEQINKAISDDRKISNELKEKVIVKVRKYIQDIADYIYNKNISKEV